MATAARGARGSIAGVHVLLVDDDRERLGLIRALLEYKGALVTVRRSSRRALLATQHVRPNVLVIHIAAAADDAIRLVQKLRTSSSVGGAIPAVALVASRRRADGERLRAGGFQACLTEPVHVSELASAIERLVRRTP
jgi:CheY-like chemotaxis protein